MRRRPQSKRHTVRLLSAMFVLVAVLAITAAPYAQEATCCHRFVGLQGFDMPEGQDWDWANQLTGEFWHGLVSDDLSDEGELEDCPLLVEISENYPLSQCEYYFYGTLSVEQTGYEEKSYGTDEDGNPTEEWDGGGDAIGNWTLTIDLWDRPNGTKLKTGTFQWEGTIRNVIADIEWYERPYDYAPMYDEVHRFREWAKQYMGEPLDEFIHKYEKLPQSCTIDMEEEVVEAGRETTIRITDVRDSKGEASKGFNVIAVRVDRGEIHGGYEKPPLLFFRVEEAPIEFTYIAPQVCDEQEERVRVYNCCDEFDGPISSKMPEDEIAEKTFKIRKRNAKRCNIAVANNKVEAGTTANVTVSNIVDSTGQPLGPKQRIMVKAGKGRIVNGMPVGDFKVFEIGDGSVAVVYEAPDDCDLAEDHIYVHDACTKIIDTNPAGEEVEAFEDTPELWEIVPGEQIRSRKVEIVCEFEWYGSLKMTQTRTFDCEIEASKASGWRKLSEHNHKSQQASLSITANGIDLSSSPAGGPKELEATGTMSFHLSDNYNFSVRPDHTTCIRRKASPGSWVMNDQTASADAVQQLDNKSVQLLLVREMLSSMDDIKDLQQQMQEAAAAMDVARIQELKSQLQAAMQPGASDQMKLVVNVTISPPNPMALVSFTYARQEYDACLAQMTKDEQSSNAQTSPVLLPMITRLNATYSTGKQGQDKISAVQDTTTTSANGKAFGADECPEIQTHTTCTLQLSRRRK